MSHLPSSSRGIDRQSGRAAHAIHRVALSVGVALALAAAPALGDATLVTVTGQNLTRIDFNGTASDFGELKLTVDLDPFAVPIVFANVLADLNDDSAFADYAAGPGTQTEWIVRNIPIYIQPDSTVNQSMTFPLIDSGVLFGDNVDLEIYLTDTAVSVGSLGSPDVATTASVGTSDRILVEPGKEGPVTPLTPDDPSATGYLPDFLDDDNITDPTDIKLNLFTPDIAQGPYECAPTSAANSLRWLAETHGFEDDIPEENSDLIDELIEDMSTSSTDGTTDANMVNGKKQFIEDNDLDIEVEFRDGNTTINDQEQEKPSYKFIWDALEAGSDIEMGFTFDDAGGGGHWVTLVGGIHFSDGSYGVYIHNPDDGEEKTVYHDLTLRDDGYLEMDGYGRSHFIDIVVTESYVPEPSSLTLLALAAAGALRRRRRTD